MWVLLVRTCGIMKFAACCWVPCGVIPWERYVWSVIFLNSIPLLCFHLRDAVTSYFPGRRYNSSTNSHPLLLSPLLMVGEECTAEHLEKG